MRRVRVGMALLVVATSLVATGVRQQPQAAAEDEPTYIFEGDRMQLENSDLQIQVDVVDRPSHPAVLSVTIGEVSDPAGEARGRRTVTYTHVARFEADPEFEHVRLYPTAEQMGDHGVIDMRFRSDNIYHRYCAGSSAHRQTGRLKGILRFDATLGARTFHVVTDHVWGTMRVDCTRTDCPSLDVTAIRGRNEPGHTYVYARALELTDGEYHTLFARRHWFRTSSGWRTRLEIHTVLPDSNVTLDEDQQHGSVQGHPGTYVRHASTFAADGPTQELDEVTCPGRAGRTYRATTSRARGSLTPGTDAGSLELRWINLRTSRWTSDDAVATYTRIRRTSG